MEKRRGGALEGALGQTSTIERSLFLNVIRDLIFGPAKHANQDDVQEITFMGNTPIRV